jgi:hypothetical protein
VSHHVRITARFRKEPDYGRLARGLLQFLEDQEKERSASPDDGVPIVPSANSRHAKESTAAKDQP